MLYDDTDSESYSQLRWRNALLIVQQPDERRESIGNARIYTLYHKVSCWCASQQGKSRYRYGVSIELFIPLSTGLVC